MSFSYVTVHVLNPVPKEKKPLNIHDLPGRPSFSRRASAATRLNVGKYLREKKRIVLKELDVRNVAAIFLDGSF